MHFFFRGKIVVSEKGLNEPVGGFIFWGYLMELLSVDKKNYFHIFSVFLKKIFVARFLVIGVKSGKSSCMGEEIRHLKKESWEAEKR